MLFKIRCSWKRNKLPIVMQPQNMRNLGMISGCFCTNLRIGKATRETRGE